MKKPAEVYILGSFYTVFESGFIAFFNNISTLP
jgi:hypothetical protein